MTLNTTFSKVRRVAMALVIGSMAFSFAPASAEAQTRKDLSAALQGARVPLAPRVTITQKEFIGLDNSVGAFPQFRISWAVAPLPANTQIVGFQLSMEVERQSGGLATSGIRDLPASARTDVVKVRFLDNAPIDPVGPIRITLKTRYRQNGVLRMITTTSSVAF